MNPLWHHGLIQYDEPIDLLRVKTILFMHMYLIVGLWYKVLYDVRVFLVHEAKPIVYIQFTTKVSPKSVVGRLQDMMQIVLLLIKFQMYCNCH